MKRIDPENLTWRNEVLRGLVDLNSEDVFVWWGDGGTHDWVAASAGVDYRDSLRFNVYLNKRYFDWMLASNVDDPTFERVLKIEEKIATLFGIDKDAWEGSCE